MNKNEHNDGQDMLLDLGIHTKISAYSKTEGAERLPQTIKISRRCTVGVFFKMQSRLLKIKTS